MKTTVPEPEAGKESGESGGKPDSEIPQGLRIKSILVPLDFSPASMQALDYANAWANQFDAKVHLLHVQAPDEASAVPDAGHLMRECAKSITFAHDKLSGDQGERVTQFWPENCHIRAGHAQAEICDLARELKVDLIIIASRGNTGLRRVLLGSTAGRVVRFSPCPVLVLRQQRRKLRFDLGLVIAKRQVRIRKILAPVDFSECSVAGAIYAASLARAFGAKLRLLHVVPPPVALLNDRVATVGPSEKLTTLTKAKCEMEAFSRLDFLRGIRTEQKTQLGYATDVIFGEADEVDLVVISTHGRSGWRRAVIGSLAEEVVRFAECPVLVVPSRCAVS